MAQPRTTSLSLSEDSDDNQDSGFDSYDQRSHSSSMMSYKSSYTSQISNPKDWNTFDEEEDDPDNPPRAGFSMYNEGPSNMPVFDDISSSKRKREKSDEGQLSSYSGPAQKMMKSMGYTKGHGLGKYRQGIVNPVEAANQRGRRGLGYLIEGFEPTADLEWDSSLEHIEVHEEVTWMPSFESEPPDLTTLRMWFTEGQKKLDISDETQFCEADYLAGVLKAKTVFDRLDSREMNKARTRSNPFETLGKLFFQNRAALKMANMDALYDFMFTRPVDKNNYSLIGREEPLYFADVCAAPGGFSEYVLWKRKLDCKGLCDAKGFGFTLKSNDFKLSEFFAAPSEFFEPHYGKNGDGDIYVPENITSFREFVLNNTGGYGVHFMMADGGFSVEGQENIQEILSKRLYLCQFLVGLGIVRSGGHFVCKLFDVFTPFSVGLVYLMHLCFERVSLHKPNTSRPANSERYIICKWRNERIEDIYNYLFEINERLEFLQPHGMDVVDIVPFNILKEDENFNTYITKSNNLLAERQIIGLRKIQSFAKNTQLVELRQQELRRSSLEFWELPDRARVAPSSSCPKTKFINLISPEKSETFHTGPFDLSMCNRDVIRSQYDYRFVVLAAPREGRKDRAFYLGLGGTNVYRWDGNSASTWIKEDTRISLPPDTLVYGELVMEYKGEWKAQIKVRTLHLIDAYVLNGYYVRDKHLTERHALLKKFAQCVNKPSHDVVPVKCKALFKLEDVSRILLPPRLQKRMMKSGGMYPKRSFCESENVDKNSYIVLPQGLMLLKTVRNPWMMGFSRSQNRKYYYNTLNKQAIFETQEEMIAHFSETYNESAIWWWNGARILEDDHSEPDKLHLTDFQQFLNSKP